MGAAFKVLRGPDTAVAYPPIQYRASSGAGQPNMMAGEKLRWTISRSSISGLKLFTAACAEPTTNSAPL
jgi:hypothetical protein